MRLETAVTVAVEKTKKPSFEVRLETAVTVAVEKTKKPSFQEKTRFRGLGKKLGFNGWRSSCVRMSRGRFISGMGDLGDGVVRIDVAEAPRKPLFGEFI